MQVDPQHDAVITRPGRCTGCGGNKPEDVPGEYCASCIGSVTQTARKQREAAASGDGSDAARREFAQRELCRRRLLPYVKRLLPNYEAGWFHKDLAARLERFARRVERGESPRLIINVPPRHGKSEQASKAFVSWFLGRNPEKQIIAATHSDKLATDNSRDVLEYIQDERHKSVFSELALNKDQKGATGWRTSQGGSYKPVGVGAGISGYGADVLIIDDPHRDKDAYSPNVRETVKRWYDSSATTRLMPGGGIILIQTRWVMDDLTGRVIDEEGSLEDGGDWEVVCYPAEAEKDEYRLPDGKIVHEPKQAAQLLRRKGEALHPERWPLELLQRHKRDPVVWAALYQQNPIAGEAAQFTREMFPECYMQNVPTGLTYYATWDTALGLKDQNDYTVRILFGVDRDDNVWIIDVARGRWDSSDIADMMIDDFFAYDLEVVGVEKTHQAMSIEPFLEKRIEERRAFGLYVHYLEHGNKDKVARSRPMQARAKQGKVLVPGDAPWFEPFMKEIEIFPGGKHDDQADAFSYAGQLLNEVTAPRDRKPQKKKSWRDNLKKYRGGKGGSKGWKAA